MSNEPGQAGSIFGTLPPNFPAAPAMFREAPVQPQGGSAGGVADRIAAALMADKTIWRWWDDAQAKERWIAQVAGAELPSRPQPTAPGELSRAEESEPWCPDFCPVTRLPFFMWIETPEGETVPTYGGPYDSYTIPELDDQTKLQWHEREFTTRRYDHDEGAWTEYETSSMRIINEQVLLKLEEAAELAATTEAEIARLRLLITTYANASNNDDSAGDAHAALLEENQRIETATHQPAAGEGVQG